MTLLISILYPLSIIISYLICRIVAKSAIENFADLVVLITFMFLPGINIIVSITLLCMYTKCDFKAITNKIFLIKGGNANDKTKRK